MWENAYLSIKNPKASRALKRALNPGWKLLTSLMRLCFATSATFSLRTWGAPLDQILDLHLILTHCRKCKKGLANGLPLQFMLGNCHSASRALDV